MHLAAIGDRVLSSSATADASLPESPNKRRSWLCRIGRWAPLPLHWLHCRWQLIRPAWFSVFIVALVVFAFLNPQTGDVLIAAAEDWVKVFMLFAGLLVFALTAWYCARANLYVDYNLLEPYSPGPHRWCHPMEPKRAVVWRCRTPRLLGVAAPACVGATYLGHAWAFGTFGRFGWLGVASLVLGAALYLGFVHRRRGETDRFTELRSKLSQRTFVWLLALLGAVAILLIVVVALPLAWPAASGVPTKLGAPFLFLLSAAFWLALGSFVLVYPTYRFRQAPSLVLVVVLFAAIMNWSPWRADDHRVRDFADNKMLTQEFGSWAKSRPDIQSHFANWLDERGEALAQADTDQPYPVFILAAEGGGVRAAYWTAAVLAELEDRMPGFACHVFGISGVSGGSLGAAIYASLIADKVVRGALDCSRRFKRPAEGPDPWIDDPRDLAKSPLLLSRATRALGQDFLAPTLAGMLYPDLLQRFLPVSFLPDRATYLESAWEAAFDLRRQVRAGACSDAGAARNGACNWMSAPFHDLWRPGERATLIPSLFLNATQVETGQRLIVSNLRLPAAPEDQVAFGDVIDAFAPDPSRAPIREPIRLSTAAGLSARFTYVSPPARLHNGAHVVDGGYYENYGVLTAHDIVRTLNASLPALKERRPSIGSKIRLVVITLLNSTFEEDETAPEPRGRGWLAATFHETWAPLAAVLQTRTARGRHAVVDLHATLPEDLHRFGLGRPGHRLNPNDFPSVDNPVRTFPLGWMLAPSTVMEMGIQAKDAVAHAAHRWLAGYAWDPAAAPAGTPRVWPGVPVGAQTVSR